MSLANAPATSLPVLVAVTADLKAYITEVVELAKGGLTLAELGKLFTDAVDLAVKSAARVNAAGSDKKVAVMYVLCLLFDKVSPFLPLWLRLPFVRTAVLDLADGVVESFVARLPAPPATPTPVVPDPQPVPVPAQPAKVA